MFYYLTTTLGGFGDDRLFLPTLHVSTGLCFYILFLPLSPSRGEILLLPLSPSRGEETKVTKSLISEVVLRFSFLLRRGSKAHKRAENSKGWSAPVMSGTKSKEVPRTLEAGLAV